MSLKLSSSTELLSTEECRDLVAACQRHDPPPSPDEIQSLVRLLIGAYPKGDMNDPDVYLRHVAAMFAGYPGSLCREVATELPTTSKFLPRVAELRAALEAKVERRHAILYRAKWMQFERVRRERERERDERIAAIPQERREKMAEQLTRMFR